MCYPARRVHRLLCRIVATVIRPLTAPAALGGSCAGTPFEESKRHRIRHVLWARLVLWIIQFIFNCEYGIPRASARQLTAAPAAGIIQLTVSPLLLCIRALISSGVGATLGARTVQASAPL